MGKFFNRISLIPKPLRYKLMIAFTLMSIIPLLICVYFATNFIFPAYKEGFNMESVSFVILITLVITILGLNLAKGMVEPIVQMALDAKRIAGGDLEHAIKITGEDEIGDLGKSLNSMTQRIKDNIAELRNYGERTKEINFEINKKVLALSGLLQIGSLISTGAELKAIMDMLADKISHMEDSNPTIIYVINEDTNTLEPVSLVNFKNTETIKRPLILGRGILGTVAVELKDFIIDRNTAQISHEMEALRQHYEIKNALVMPILLHDKCKGVLLTGNKVDSYVYSKDDLELIRVFVKQAAIALENDALIKKAEELEVVDDLTGLYNEKYINERLEDEIKRSIIYQRPCSFLMLKLGEFEFYCSQRGRMAGEAALKKVAKSIADSLTPVDKAARFADDEFAIVLPERNKKEADAISLEIKKKISDLTVDSKADIALQKLNAYVGISENPIDGTTALELVQKARQRVKDAMALQTKKNA